MLRTIIALFLSVFLLTPLAAQEQSTSGTPVDRSATGGAQTLQDIMNRQNGIAVNEDFRRNAIGNPDSAAPMTDQLGTLGGVSQAEDWRALRFGEANITVSAGGNATPLMQSGGMRWLKFREGPLSTYGIYLLGGTVLLLALFYLLRGKIRIDGEKTGRTVTRFKAVERFGHWLLAGSFIVLALTGLVSLFGRKVVIPLLGKESFSTIAIGSKWVHNNVAWAFILGLMMIFVMWVAHNIPNRTDLKWIAQGGGLLKKGVHPPAKKFNFGQKIIFWSVILLGSSIAITGVSLLFPFQMPMFDATFNKLNAFGIPQALGMGELATSLSPQAEMQLTQLWHAIVGFILMAIIIAHIYIGSIGMEGAYDAMGSGEVEEQWAREHHSIWVAEELEKSAKAPDAAEPAE
ncbi:MAG: formate dehydrogenase subunit gamma [Paracoccaceae bacterium]